MLRVAVTKQVVCVPVFAEVLRKDFLFDRLDRCNSHQSCWNTTFDAMLMVVFYILGKLTLCKDGGKGARAGNEMDGKEEEGG